MLLLERASRGSPEKKSRVAARGKGLPLARASSPVDNREDFVGKRRWPSVTEAAPRAEITTLLHAVA